MARKLDSEISKWPVTVRKTWRGQSLNFLVHSLNALPSPSSLKLKFRKKEEFPASCDLHMHLILFEQIWWKSHTFDSRESNTFCCAVLQVIPLLLQLVNRIQGVRSMAQASGDSAALDEAKRLAKRQKARRTWGNICGSSQTTSQYAK